MLQPNIPRVNPLAQYMRQPKIYITLPSKGNYWPMGSLEFTETGEFPVYSMTARDELLFKTPDALMNGQAMVDVIESCMPNVKNAWDMPTIDLDTVLLAIRLATYGEYMNFAYKVPVVNEEEEYQIDLKVLIAQQQNNYWIDQVVINPDFIIFVKPLTLRHMTKNSIKNFENNRIFSLVNDESLSDEQKLEMFNQSFANLAKATIELIAENIYKILTPNGEVTDRDFILEFVNNSDKEIFKTVKDHLQEMKNNNDLKPIEFSTTQEQQSNGAPITFSVPINFNNSDFFG
jgi:hypothetical protein